MRSKYGTRYGTDDRYNVDKETGCWLWYGATFASGYPALWKYGKMVRAHKYFYEQKYGPVPLHMVVGHVCPNITCVNPMHLTAMTQADNVHGATHVKLSPLKAEYIRTLAEQGMSRKELAKEFGVCVGRIDDVINNKAWISDGSTQTQ